MAFVRIKNQKFGLHFQDTIIGRDVHLQISFVLSFGVENRKQKTENRKRLMHFQSENAAFKFLRRGER